MCISAEWDSYVEANDLLADRLAKNGRLDENLVYPGGDHGFFYHQDYKIKNPNNPYIWNVSVPRIEKFKSNYTDLLKKE